MAVFFLDTYGRKMTLTIDSFFMQLSTALLVWSPSFGVMIAARVLEDVSIGLLLLGYQVNTLCVAWKILVKAFVRSMQLKSPPKRIEVSYPVSP
jgi:MFS family permease